MSQTDCRGLRCVPSAAPVGAPRAPRRSARPVDQIDGNLWRLRELEDRVVHPIEAGEVTGGAYRLGSVC